jgi:hypothetical protein
MQLNKSVVSVAKKSPVISSYYQKNIPAYYNFLRNGIDTDILKSMINQNYINLV